MKTLLYLFIALTISLTIIWDFNGKDFNLYDYFVNCVEKIDDLNKPDIPSFSLKKLQVPSINGFDDLLECVNNFFSFIIQPIKIIYDLIVWLIEWLLYVFGFIGVFGGGLIL